MVVLSARLALLILILAAPSVIAEAGLTGPGAKGMQAIVTHQDRQGIRNPIILDLYQVKAISGQFDGVRQTAARAGCNQKFLWAGDCHPCCKEDGG